MSVAGLIIATGMVYFVDYVVLRARGANGLDSVQVEVVDVIPEKGNKAEYVPQGASAQTCVRAIFPHLGNQPCWYLRKHTNQQVNF